MANAATITISGLTDATGLGEASGNPREAATKLASILWGIANGSLAGSSLTIANSSTAPARAAGTVTIATGSGSIACVVNGTSVAVTWGTSDTATATALAAAINANTTVNKLVSASANAGVVTVTAHVPGVQGGAISFTASGTGATITGSGKLGGATTGAGSDAAPTTYSF